LTTKTLFHLCCKISEKQRLCGALKNEISAKTDLPAILWRLFPHLNQTSLQVLEWEKQYSSESAEIGINRIQDKSNEKQANESN